MIVMVNPAISSRYERKLSPTERAWIGADELNPPFVMQAVLEGEGEFDLACWQNAASKASAANPGSRLVLEGHLGWSRWVDSGVAVKVHLLDGSNWTGASPEGASFLNRPLPVRSGPTCEILLLTGTPKRVILRVHHAVMDGMGGTRFMVDLFRELRGEASLGARGFQTDLDIARRIGTGGFKMVWDNCLSPLMPSTADELMTGSTWRRITVPGVCSKPLARITLALAQNAYEVNRHRHASTTKVSKQSRKPATVRFDISVDMRQHCPELPPSTANLTGIITIEVSDTDTLADVLDAIRIEREGRREGVFFDMLAPLRWVPVRLGTYCWRFFSRRAHKNNRYISSGTISNFGRPPFKHYHGGGFRAITGFGVPGGGEGVPLGIVFNSVGQQTEIVAVAPQCVASGDQLESFLEGLRDNLLTSAD